jgi:hypothetical protein
MPVDIGTTLLWLGLAVAAEPPKPPAAPRADAELIEFLGSFETKTGAWPELNDILSARSPATPAAPLPPTKDTK